MKKTLRRLWHIFRSQSFVQISDDPYATHLPVLVGLATRREIRAVLEIGSGKHSTALFMNKAIYRHTEEITSYENNSHWFAMMKSVVQGDSRVDLRFREGDLSDYVKEVDVSRYDLVFVDDAMTAAARAATVEAVLRQNPKVVVIHDFEVFAYRRIAHRLSEPYRIKALLPNVGVCGNMTRADLRRIEVVISKNKAKIPVDDVGQWYDVFTTELAVGKENKVFDQNP